MKSRPTLVWLLFGMIFVPAAAMVFSCMGCGLVAAAYEKIVGTQLSRTVLIPFLIVSSIIIMLWMLSEVNRYFTALDDENLHFGLIRQTTLPFSEIQAIIIGLPDRMTAVMNLSKYLNYSSWQVALAARRRALLIVKSDHSIMQMNIHLNKNGTGLMRMFLDSNDEKVLIDYAYSDEQAELLKRPKWNRIRRSSDIENAFRHVRAG